MAQPPPKGGRNYVPKTPDLRLRQKVVDVYLLGPALPALSSGGKLPLRGDVLRYIVGRINRHPRGQKPERHILCPLASGTTSGSCYSEKGCVSLGDRCVVAEVKEDSWLKSKLPMKDDRALSKLIMEDYSMLKRLKKEKGRKTEAAESLRERFKEKMGKTFEAAHTNAKALIRKDRLRSKEAIDEDILFLEDQLCGRRVGKVGMPDVAHNEAVLKKIQRTVKARQQVELTQEKVLEIETEGTDKENESEEEVDARDKTSPDKTVRFSEKLWKDAGYSCLNSGMRRLECPN